MLQNSLWPATHCVIFNLARGLRVEHGTTSGLGFGGQAVFSLKRPRTRRRLTATELLRPPTTTRSEEVTLGTSRFQCTSDVYSWTSPAGIRFAFPSREQQTRMFASSPETVKSTSRSVALAVNLYDCQKSRGVQPTLSILPCRFAHSQNVTRPVERHEQTKSKPSRIQIVVQGDLWNKWKTKQQKKQKKNKAIGSSVKGKKGHINPPSDLCGLLTVSERNRNASVAYLSCRIHLCCYTSKSFGIKLKRKRKRTVQSNKQPSSLPFSPCLNQTGVNCWFLLYMWNSGRWAATPQRSILSRFFKKQTV